jgi:4-amino-4-deoxy-L-arabinose transferase-like glycosyltransferase
MTTGDSTTHRDERSHRGGWAITVRRYAPLLLGLLFAFALRVYRLGDQSIWWDEGYSLWVARMGVVNATLHTATDTHPPLYYWLLAPWLRIAGQTEFAGRYLSVLLAQLNVALLVPLARRVSRRRWIAVLAVGFLALSRFHIWWSQEIRMYILAGLCSTASLYFTLRLTERKLTTGTWLGWVLSTLGALYTVYASITLVLVENLFMLIVGLRRKWRWGLWQRWVLVQVVVGLAVVPWLMLALPRMHSWSTPQALVSLAFVLNLDAVLLTQGISADVEQYLTPAVAAIAVMAAGLALCYRPRRSASGGPQGTAGGLLLGIAVLLQPLIIWLLTQPRDFFYTPTVEARYLLPFAPAFYVLLALSLAGWARIRWRRSAGAVVSTALVSMALSILAVSTLPGYYASRYLRDDFITLTYLLEERRRAEDAVVLYPDRGWPVFAAHYAGPWHPIPDGMPVTDANITNRLAPVWSTASGIWLVITPDAQRMDPAGLVPAWLADRAVAQQHWSLGVNAVTFYARTAERADALHQLAPDFESPTQLKAQLPSGAALAGYRAPLSRYRTGDTAFLALYWRTPPQRPFDLLLAGPAERLHTVDAPMPASAGLTPQLVALPLTPDLPAGQYSVQLPGADPASVTLGSFALTHPPGPRRTTGADAIAHLRDAELGETIRFLGYTLDREYVSPGETLEVTLYWETSDVIAARYKVFVHLLGETFNADTGNFLWGQHDAEPGNGALPTTQWTPGTVIADVHTVPVASGAPPGTYTLQVGLYNPLDGARLPVRKADGPIQDNAIVLTEIQVR